MRILLVTNHFDPEPNHLKGSRFAQDLVRRGHEVHVLTGFPNYPGGRIYAGYRVRWTAREEVAGIPVTRVAMYASHDASAVRRVLSYASVGASLAAHGLAIRDRYDICYVYLGPITLMWAAVVLRATTGARILCDVQDIWPESVTDSGMLRSAFAGHLLERWSAWAYTRADRLIALSPGYLRRLVELGVPEGRVHVVYNWCEERRAPTGEAASSAAVLDPASFNVVYAGNFGKLQGIDTILDAAKLLRGRQPAVRFTLIGYGVDAERLRRRVRDEQIENVAMLERMPVDRVNAIQARADALLIHVEPTRLTRMGIPSKVQSCLAAGRPLVVAAEGDAKNLVDRSRGGLTCPPRDPAAMARAIETLAVMRDEQRAVLGANAREFFAKELGFERGVDEIEGVLRDLAAAPAHGRGGASLRLQRIGKRAMDVAIAAVGLAMASPLLLLVAVLVRITMGPPVLFAQERPGLRGRTFRLFKFRSMRDARDAAGGTLPDELRLTRTGAFLRSTSLDELPQLWNVLRGDLSLVGPRPLLTRYLGRYTPEQARRHDVKPGITGWAQVNGRNAISWEEKFALDVWYVDHWSFWLDLKILGMTIMRVLDRRGISRRGHATMPEFFGIEQRNGEWTHGQEAAGGHRSGGVRSRSEVADQRDR